jgi:hypothetical protein
LLGIYGSAFSRRPAKMLFPSSVRIITSSQNA